ncbi:MAG: DUF2339 domain-containing protein, partial [Devosia sp.]
MDFLGFVLAVIALFLFRHKQGQIDAFRQRLAQLEYRVTDLRDAASQQTENAPADAAEPAPVAGESPDAPPENAEAIPSPEPQPDDAPLPPRPPPPPGWGPWAQAARGASTDIGGATAPRAARPRFDIERAMGVQLPVWGGAIMLLVAGFFLARMAADNGFFTPTLGVLASALGGLVMLGGAALVSARQIANYRQIGAALASAAIGTFYATAFMASAAFGLTSLFTGFLLSAATAAVAMPIALRFGQPVLGVGLLGGYLAPFFLLEETPSQLLINCYLAALLAAAAVTAARKGWWRMLVAAIIVHFLWLAALTLANSVPGLREASTLVALVLTPIALFALWSRAEDLRTAHPHLGWLGAAFSAACLIGGSYLTDFEVPHLIAFAALLVASAPMILIDRTRTIHPSLGALGAWFALLLAWRDPEPFARLALVAVALLSIGLPLVLKLWAGQQARLAAIGLSLLGMGSFVTSMVDLDGWGGMRDLPILWALLALGVAALSVMALRLFAPRAPEADQPFVRAIFAASASAYLSLAIVAVVDPNYFALAAALQVLGLALIFRRYGVESLLTLAAVYFGLYFVLLAISTTGAGMVVWEYGLADYLPALWPDDAPVVTLILPALAFLGA